MKVKVITIITALLITISAFSQQIGDGKALGITDLTVPLNSGIYEAINPVGSIPDLSYSGWQHLLVTRHSNSLNNHELQIASSFTDNDRLFFRKATNYTLFSVNPTWNEVATRGANNFIGNQNIEGNVGIGTSQPNVPLTVYGVSNFFPARIGSGDARSLEISNTGNSTTFISNQYPVFL
ncbi:hypothetical protein PQ462_05430 [Flavobacterium sp. KACC 22758]|jgi:hypothetical protein|uniref:hypothetical protein n=1 Tax=Flavobacterium sp. KACC 22758 TaxID=3025667 RepID=UPI002365EF8F|nr:hypothetical protein [Flavobacterium sp. KACC 22758]WDF60802.1 hypothetical protein PQ462_05430 [Flavobacterium sp. KACC 22758]